MQIQRKCFVLLFFPAFPFHLSSEYNEESLGGTTNSQSNVAYQMASTGSMKLNPAAARHLQRQQMVSQAETGKYSGIGNYITKLKCYLICFMIGYTCTIMDNP